MEEIQYYSAGLPLERISSLTKIYVRMRTAVRRASGLICPCGLIRLPTARVGPPIPIPKDRCICGIEGSLRLCPARLLPRNILKHIVLVRLRLLRSSFTPTPLSRSVLHACTLSAKSEIRGHNSRFRILPTKTLKVHNREFAV